MICSQTGFQPGFETRLKPGPNQLETSLEPGWNQVEAKLKPSLKPRCNQVWNKFEATPVGAAVMTGVLVWPPTRKGVCAGTALTAKGPDCTNRGLDTLRTEPRLSNWVWCLCTWAVPSRSVTVLLWWESVPKMYDNIRGVLYMANQANVFQNKWKMYSRIL